MLAAGPPAWERAGFAVDGDACTVGSVRLRLAGEETGSGILRWSLRGAPAGDLDGLPTEPSAGPGEAARAHPNGALALDHVVVLTRRASGAWW